MLFFLPRTLTDGDHVRDVTSVLVRGKRPPEVVREILQGLTPPQFELLFQEVCQRWDWSPEAHRTLVTALLRTDLTSVQLRELHERQENTLPTLLFLDQTHLPGDLRLILLRRHYLEEPGNPWWAVEKGHATPTEIAALMLLHERWGRGDHPGYAQAALEAEQLEPGAREIFWELLRDDSERGVPSGAERVGECLQSATML